MSTLTALTCSLPNPVRQWAPETARSGGAPSSGRCAAACYPSRRAVHQHVDDEGLRATQLGCTLARDPTPPMKVPPGTPNDCDAPGYSGGKPKMVWGSMVRGESPARMEPRGRWKILQKFFVNYHLKTLPFIPAQPNTQSRTSCQRFRAAPSQTHRARSVPVLSTTSRIHSAKRAPSGRSVEISALPRAVSMGSPSWPSKKACSAVCPSRSGTSSQSMACTRKRTAPRARWPPPYRRRSRTPRSR